MPLIVLEGLDGAGKSTQLDLLKNLASNMGHQTEFLHFPRVEIPIYGELIAGFLRGDFGEQEQVDPYMVALLFAGDRADAGLMLQKWLDAGKYVFLDRYVYSNVGFQCAKVCDPEKRMALKKWILHLEFVTYGIPRPDISLFLDVPFRFTEERLSEQREGKDREYLHGARDIHESSLDLQRRVREVYLEAARTDPALKIVDCGDPEGRMLPPDAIFKKILSNLGNIL